MGLLDGIPSLEVLSLTVSGTTAAFTNLSGTTLVVNASEVGNAELANNAASGIKVSLEYGVIATGSPVVYGLGTQVGAGSLGGGSAVWTVFGKPFAAAPRVIVTPVGPTARTSINVFAGSITAGSFFAFGGAADENFHYIATGSVGANRI